MFEHFLGLYDYVHDIETDSIVLSNVIRHIDGKYNLL